MNEIMKISQQLVNQSLPTKFGDGSRYGAMLDEYSTHHRALSVLNEASKHDKKIGISTMLVATYVLEIGLKCLSYLSHEGYVYSITSDEYNAKKNSLSTGVYKIIQGNSIKYKNIVRPCSPEKDDLKLRDGKNIRNNTTGTCELIEDKLMANKLSQDELLAIFENYAPYPKTHKYIDIFKSIRCEYQQNVYSKFKEHFCYYLTNYTTSANNDYSVQSVERLPFDEFKNILKNMHNFIDFRYLSAGNENVRAHGGLLSSLNEAVRAVLLNIEQVNLSKLNSHYRFTPDMR